MKMKDPWEKIIRENRESFEEEPAEGHSERFRQKLDKSAKKKINRRLVLEMAAAVLIIILAGNQIRTALQPDHIENKYKESTLPLLPGEYAEAKTYYLNSISQGMTQWKELLREGMIPEKEQQLMETEIREFEQTCARLQKELQASPDDERVISAMLEVYQTRLNIIRLIIQKLKQSKPEKEGKHEIDL
ncbi:MAG: hypothetical protein AB7D05_08850 [Mangrovibacterium sp.]